MPVLSNDAVNLLPVTCRTNMSLSEIRDALAVRPPDRATYTPGWASTDNNASNMGIVNGTPPPSEPELVADDGTLPEMVRARFYYWTPLPQATTSIAAVQTDYRTLHGLDVIITDAGAERVSIVVSSRSHQLTRRRDGAIRTLEKIFRLHDDTIRADFKASAFSLEDSDIFLWLAVRITENPQIDGQIKLDRLSGISGTDASRRTADLRAGVDFERPNFLTAVAEADTLGPVELSFVRTTAEGRSSFKLRLHADGGFEIHKTGISYPTFAGNEDMMLRASYELLFDLVPHINHIYARDTAWATKRQSVILEAMTYLSERYTNAMTALRERLNSSPTAE